MQGSKRTLGWRTNFLPNEEDAHACVVFCPLQIEILVHAVDLSVDDGITIKEVHEVHDPKHWLWLLVTSFPYASRTGLPSCGCQAS